MRKTPRVAERLSTKYRKLFAGSKAMLPPVTLVELRGQLLLLIANGPGESRSGSTRQMPAVPSATHKCRTGWLVSGLAAVPYSTIPPLAPVIRLVTSGVPANWIVCVPALTAFCALAAALAIARNVTRQYKTRMEEYLTLRMAGFTEEVGLASSDVPFRLVSSGF